MTRYLPPLNSLRAFEAAARHGSFTKAASELFVTPGAVSRQVQVLEEHLGTALFQRKNREVIITARGEEYREALTSAFMLINQSTKSIKMEKKLKVSCYLTFGMNWLVPRISRFIDKHPNYPVSISTTTPNLFDVVSGTVDVAILAGDGGWSGVEYHKLFPYTIEPVVSPELLKTTKLESPKDLENIRLLQSSARPDDWDFWLDQSDPDPELLESRTMFESSCLAFQAAKNGLGAAIGQHAMLTREFERGELVAPFNQRKHDGTWFYLAYSQKFADHRQVISFKKWILEEVERFNTKHKILEDLSDTSSAQDK
jgi:LysR family glycine cleavage system transcriptional activator